MTKEKKDINEMAKEDFGKLRSRQSADILVELIPKLIEVRELSIRLINSQQSDDDVCEVTDSNFFTDLHEQIQIARRELDKKLS